MEEMAGAGHIHGDIGLTSRFEHLFVTDGSSWLHDGLDPCIDQDLGTIGEREERIGCGYCAPGAIDPISQRVGAFDRQVGGIHTIDLSHADADGRLLAMRRPDP